ncbi:MAG: hypothetical protein AMJ93_10375 [Anaerolineae bacterium SM23_84]|nr:MAG: hypothetical protein AMJ93_10375 [Anaerolineae bacterium SM23_84]
MANITRGIRAQPDLMLGSLLQSGVQEDEQDLVQGASQEVCSKVLKLTQHCHKYRSRELEMLPQGYYGIVHPIPIDKA